jgi:hypothetical protein
MIDLLINMSEIYGQPIENGEGEESMINGNYPYPDSKI